MKMLNMAPLPPATRSPVMIRPMKLLDDSAASLPAKGVDDMLEDVDIVAPQKGPPPQRS